MKTRIKINAKLFCKSPVLIIGLLIGLAAPHLMMWDRATIILSMADYDVYSMWNFLLLYAAIPFMIIAFLSYEYVKKTKDVELWESVQNHANGGGKILLSQIPVLFIVMLLLILNYISYGVASCFAYAGQAVMVWGNILLAVLLYFILPGCLALALGMFLALKQSRPGAYGIIALWSVVMSPLVGDKMLVTYPAFVYRLREFVNICTSNERWINPLYGIMTEWYRFALVLFWIFLFVCAVQLVVTKQKYGKVKKMVLPVTLCVLCCTAYFCKTGYITSDSGAKNGTGRLSMNVYGHYESEHTKADNIPADFTVTQMDLDFHINQELKAVATVHVSDLGQNDSLKFTLQHSYEIKSIVDENKKELPFTRTDLDFITVDISKSPDIKSLTFTYSGCNGQHFAKKQGIMLPGNISYYPVEGWQSSFYSSTGFGAEEQTKPILPYPRQIHLNLHTTTKGVNVSLPKNKDGTYSGISNGISIIGGYTTNVSLPSSDISVVCPFLRQSFYMREVDAFEQRLSEIDLQLGTNYQKMMASKPVYLYAESEFAVFDDQIMGIGFSDHMVIKSIFTKNLADALPVVFAFTDTNRRTVAQMLFAYWGEYTSASFLQIYGDKIPAIRGEDTLFISFKDLAPQFLKSMGYNPKTRQVDPEKEAAVLKQIGAYLMDDADTRTAQQFVQSLG